MSSCLLGTGILSGYYKNRCPDNTGTNVRILQDACTKLARIITLSAVSQLKQLISEGKIEIISEDDLGAEDKTLYESAIKWF